MFKILKRIDTFMDTPGEWHSIVIGVGDGFAFRKTDTSVPVEENQTLGGELWYHRFGLVIGRVGFLVAITGAIDFLMRV